MTVLELIMRLQELLALNKITPEMKIGVYQEPGYAMPIAHTYGIDPHSPRILFDVEDEEEYHW